MIEASWEGDTHILSGLRVTTNQRPNILADITNALRPMNISITRAEYKPGKDGKSRFEFVFEAPDQESANRAGVTIQTVAGVTAVDRMTHRDIQELRKSS